MIGILFSSVTLTDNSNNLANSRRAGLVMMKSNDQKLANIDFELRELEKRKQALLVQRKSIERMGLMSMQRNG